MPLDVTALYRTSGAMVLRRARSLLWDADAARDVCQDVFLALHRALASGDAFLAGTMDERRVRAWLYRVTTNQCFHVLRDRKTRARLLVEHGDLLVGAAPVRAEEWSVVRRTLRDLPESVAMAAVYFHMDGMTYDEIAEVMGCSRRHVGHLLEELKVKTAAARRSA